MGRNHFVARLIMQSFIKIIAVVGFITLPGDPVNYPKNDCRWSYQPILLHGERRF
jgi:hypothetical protein